MAKVGYIYRVTDDGALDTARQWMLDYGCVQVVEELPEHERLRPQWKQLLATLERGDELVVQKFSNAVRGSRELAALIELCRVKVVRLVSVDDRIDTRGELFPDTRPAQVMEMFGSLPEEVAVLRKASAHVQRLQNSLRPLRSQKVRANERRAELARALPSAAGLSGSNAMTKAEREKTIVEMYNENYSIDDIWRVSGFSSRSSVFRILNKYGVSLNRGRFSGPLGPRKAKEETMTD